MKEDDQLEAGVTLHKLHLDTDQEIFAEDFDEETSVLHKLCLLPFEPIWYNFIVVLGLINGLAAILTCIRAVTGAEMQFFVIFYFCDVMWFINTSLLLTTQYMGDLKTTQLRPPHRELYWLIVDYISVIPVELFFPTNLRSYIALTKTLKIMYIMYIFHFVNSMLELHVWSRVFQLISQLLYFVMLASLGFAWISRVYDANAQERSVSEIVYYVVDHMTNSGFGYMAAEHYLNKLLVNTCSVVILVGVLLIGTANVTFLVFTALAEKTSFRFKRSGLQEQFRHQPVSTAFADCMDDFLQIMWTHAYGCEEAMGGSRAVGTEKCPSMLSPTFFAEITVDMCTEIFRHSILLHQLPVAFLRDLSLHVSFEVYQPHQLLFKLNELKERMVYIHKGIVEIITDEDGESSMMELTAGTCLSEVCLLVPYRSNFVVRCRSACTFHTICSRNFLQVARRHPVVAHKLRGVIAERFADAKRLKSIQEVHNRRADRTQRCTNMSWLLYILHRMMGNAHPHVAVKHTLANLQLQRIFSAARFRKHIFAPTFLCLYAVPEEQQDYVDTLFAQSSFPYVLKPDTGLTFCWELLIAFVAVIAGLILPYLAFTHRSVNTTPLLQAVYSFTGVWLLDLIIQLRISIVYGKKVVSGFLNVLIMKLTNFIFILDLISVLPLELFTGVFVYESNRNYIYMNRILKLARVVRLLRRWEKRFDSNPLYVRSVCGGLFVLYSAYILSCVYYYLAYRGVGGFERFETLLFYSTEIVTGVSLWVEGYSDLVHFHALNIVVFLATCMMSSVMYALIFSAYTSAQLHLLRLRHSTRTLVQAATAVDGAYGPFIQDFMRDVVTLDGGAGFRMHASPNYFYRTVPRDFLAYLYDVKFEMHIGDLPIFAAIDPPDLKHIFVDVATTLYHAPNEVVFHVGDLLNEVLVLLDGVCEAISGVTLQSTIMRAPCELNGVEVALHLPMHNTLITLTHCHILHVRYATLYHVLCERIRVESFDDMRARFQHTHVKYFSTSVLDLRKQRVHQRSHINYDRLDDAFLSAYVRTGLFKVRWMFMNLTFYPDGNFLHRWEMGRCACAVLSALGFSSITFCFYSLPHPIAIVKWALEIVALLDIYVRLHVAYYNELGLLVSHPGETVLHYVKNGLLVDVVTALPMHLAMTQPNHIFINVNKLLQLHRFVRFVRFNDDSRVVPARRVNILTLLPLTFVFVNMTATFLLLLNCSMDVRDSQVNIVCDSKESLFLDADVQITNANVAHVYAIYIVMSVISKIAVQGFTVRGRTNRLCVALLSLIAFAMYAMKAARVFAHYVNEYDVIIRNHLDMKLLKAFLLGLGRRRGGVGPLLFHAAEEHVKHIWLRDKINLHKHSQGFPENLRRDLLYAKFAPTLQKSLLVGAIDKDPFIRNLLSRSTYLLLEKNGLLQKKNDVCNHAIIIFSGLVAIEHGESVTLGPGTILGNAFYEEYSRLELTVVALGRVELLSVRSNVFFEVLKQFPSCQETHYSMLSTHKTFIPGESNFHYSTPKRTARLWKLKQFPNTSWTILLLLSTCGAFLSQYLYFHDIITATNRTNLVHLSSDAVYVLAIVLVFFVPITNEQGNEMSWKDVVHQFFKPWRFYLALTGAIPVYLCIPSTLDDLTIFYMTTAARGNVLVRNVFFFRVVDGAIARSPSTMYTLTFLVNLLVIVNAIGGIAALLVLLADVQAANMRPPISLRTLLRAPLVAKYEHLVTFVYFVTNMFTHTSQRHYAPAGLAYVLVFIVLMCLVMVYHIATYSRVVAMVQSIDQLKLRYVRRKRRLQALMHRSSTSQIMYDRVDHYARTTWSLHRGFRIPHLFTALPAHLRETLLAALTDCMLDTHDLFGSVHHDLRRQLYTHLRLDYFFHGDFIAYEGTVNETMYFVHTGTVVSLRPDGSVMRVSEPGDSFALLQGVIYHLPHNLSHRAVSDAIIFSLIRSDWYHMLQFYPASKRIIKHICQSLSHTQQ